jgi:hypothetical protein
MLVLVGLLLLALGLVSGGALVLAAFEVLQVQAPLTLWVTFPLLCIVGFVLIGGHAPHERVRTVSLATSALMLLLAVASIAGLVLGAAGIVPQPASTTALWYVLLVGIILGSLGGAAFARRAAEP